MYFNLNYEIHIASIPPTYKIFQQLFGQPKGQIFTTEAMQSQLSNVNHCLYSRSRTLMDFKDDYNEEVTYLLIRFFNAFLEKQRMLTETVFRSEKSTLKYRI